MLPPRYRESAFQFYEEIIADIVKDYPQPKTYNPAKFRLSGVTFSCRLRDAMRSHRQNHWPSMKVSWDKFMQAYDTKIVVSEVGGLVYVGDRETVKWRNPKTPLNPNADADVVAPKPPYRLVAIFPNYQSFVPLCELAHARMLVAPIIVNVQAAWAQVALESYDIDLELQNDGTYLLI